MSNGSSLRLAAELFFRVSSNEVRVAEWGLLRDTVAIPACTDRKRGYRKQLSGHHGAAPFVPLRDSQYISLSIGTEEAAPDAPLNYCISPGATSAGDCFLQGRRIE